MTEVWSRSVPHVPLKVSTEVKHVLGSKRSFLFMFFVFLDTWGGSVPVSQSEESCGVRLSREKDQSLSFYSRYDSCYVQTEVKETSVQDSQGK